MNIRVFNGTKIRVFNGTKVRPRNCHYWPLHVGSQRERCAGSAPECPSATYRVAGSQASSHGPECKGTSAALLRRDPNRPLSQRVHGMGPDHAAQGTNSTCTSPTHSRLHVRKSTIASRRGASQAKAQEVSRPVLSYHCHVSSYRLLVW